MGEHPSAPEGAPTFDDIAAGLRRLRAGAGDPSYAEIVRLIAAQRQARGVPAEAARPGRTTVYDAFRPGRRRIDPALVVEIVRALGGDDEEAARWEASCRAARQHTVATREVAAEPVIPAAEAEDDLDPAAGRRRGVLLAVGLVACVLVNLVGRVTIDALRLPLYLDMVGTAVAAVVAGPWWGALVGVATNAGGTFTSGADSMVFGLVNVAGALVWGYGVRRFAMGRTVPRFFVLNVVVALVCTLVAVPIILFGFGGQTGHGSDSVAATFEEVYHQLALAVLSANLLTSVADKLISGFVALAVADALPRADPAARS